MTKGDKRSSPRQGTESGREIAGADFERRLRAADKRIGRILALLSLSASRRRADNPANTGKSGGRAGKSLPVERLNASNDK